MEIKEIMVNGNRYTFTNEFKSNRQGFKHLTTVFWNGRELGDYSKQYYNRTWESYEYQSVMRGCINNLIEKHYNNFIDVYKGKYNINRLIKAKREDADREFNELAEVKEFKQVLAEL